MCISIIYIYTNIEFIRDKHLQLYAFIIAMIYIYKSYIS